MSKVKLLLQSRDILRPERRGPSAEKPCSNTGPDQLPGENTISRSTPDWGRRSEILLGVVEAIRKDLRERARFRPHLFRHHPQDHRLHPPKKGRSSRFPNQSRALILSAGGKPGTGQAGCRTAQNLRPRHADILYLHYYLDMSRDEIGWIYGISPEGWGVLIAAARQTMKNLIKKLGVPLPEGTPPL
jgi:hypothetical protein